MDNNQITFTLTLTLEQMARVQVAIDKAIERYSELYGATGDEWFPEEIAILRSAKQATENADSAVGGGL